MTKSSKLKFSEYMQNISRSKSFGKFVRIVNSAFFLEYSTRISKLEPTLIQGYDDIAQKRKKGQVDNQLMNE